MTQMSHYLVYDARLFQQILFYFGAFNWSIYVEMYVDVFTKTARIVVSYSLGITKRCIKSSVINVCNAKTITFRVTNNQ